MSRSGTALWLAMLLSTAPALAGWQETITPADAAKLESLDEARARGLSEAEAGASAADLATIRSILNASPITARMEAAQGRWRCRQMKLGGVTPAIVYTWFHCRISRGADGWRFEKVTGTARTAGTLYPAGDGFVYLGAQSVKTEPQHRYSGNGDQLGAAATPDDQAGVFSLLSDGRARIELPYPTSRESSFDVIELRR